MPTVVIIHAADDALPARALGEKLRQANLTPVLEKAPGRERQDAIKSAAVSIALWSPRSGGDQAAIEDAGVAARSKGKVLHAAMQSVGPPDPFRNENYVDLTGWRGEDDFHAWRELAKRVTHAAGVPPLPPPAARAPSGFFQPGRVDAGAQQAPPTAQGQRPAQRAPQAPPPPRQAAPPAQPRAQAAPPPRAAAQPSRAEPDAPKRGPNMVLIGIITFIVVAALGGGGYWYMQQQGGGAAAAWAEVDQSDPAALRAFMDGQPGDFRDEAQTAYTALEEQRFNAAMSSRDLTALRAFVADFPEGDRSTRARGAIAELEMEAASAAPAPLEEAAPAETAPEVAPETSGGPAQLTEPAPESPPDAEPPPSAPSP